MRQWIMLFGWFLMVSNSYAQSQHQLLMEGNRFYENGQYDKALEVYEQALADHGPSLKTHYNLANAYFQQGEYDKAIEQYEAAAQSTEKKAAKSDSYYNLGNTHLAKANHYKEEIKKILEENENAQIPPTMQEEWLGSYKKSRDAYKNALRQNPSDFEAKHNLAHVQRILKQLIPPPQNQNQQNQQQNQNQDQNQQDPNNPQKKEQDKGQEKQEQNVQNNDPSDNPKEMEKEDLERLMQIVENEEKKVQEKLMQQLKGVRAKSDKTW